MDLDILGPTARQFFDGDLMPQSHAQVWLHTVFSTKNRQAFLEHPDLREQMFRMLASCQRDGLCGRDRWWSRRSRTLAHEPFSDGEDLQVCRGCCVRSTELKLTNVMFGINCRAVGPANRYDNPSPSPSGWAKKMTGALPLMILTNRFPFLP